jgi:predicted lipoprotein with Yx(FWY)xxD motif
MDDIRSTRRSSPAAMPGRIAGSARRCAATLIALAATVGATACGVGAPASSPAYRLQSRTIAGLGEVVTDGKGFTLYLYAPDHQGPSRCSGFCAQQWPPLLLPPGVDKPAAGPGVRPALLGTTRRADGRLQETYNGWPLYLWIGDSAPGQATGQADDMGLWYAVSVTGAVDRGTVR